MTKWNRNRIGDKGRNPRWYKVALIQNKLFFTKKCCCFPNSPFKMINSFSHEKMMIFFLGNMISNFAIFSMCFSGALIWYSIMLVHFIHDLYYGISNGCHFPYFDLEVTTQKKVYSLGTLYDVTYISYMNGICAKHASTIVEKTQTNSDIDSINN